MASGKPQLEVVVGQGFGRILVSPTRGGVGAIVEQGDGVNLLSDERFTEALILLCRKFPQRAIALLLHRLGELAGEGGGGRPRTRRVGKDVQVGEGKRRDEGAALFKHL